jgi:hypothetical protein
MPLVQQVNYLAVLICGVIAIGIGFLWRSPMLLGHIWIEAFDESEEELKKESSTFKGIGLSFVGHLFIAYSLAQLMAHSNAASVVDGIRLSFLCWMGFIMAPMAINTLLAGRSLRLLLVDSGYHLIVLLIFGVVLGAWTI